VVVSVEAERFRSLYEAEVIALLGYAARRLDRPSDAADVVADVFTVAWRRIDEVPTRGDARPWLFGVANNVMSNHRRGARRRDRLADRLRGELRMIPTSTPAPSDDVLLVRQALGRLSDDDRELLLLTNWEGLSPAEVAVAMGIPPGTVRSRLHRARQQLRRRLGPGFESPTSSNDPDSSDTRNDTEDDTGNDTERCAQAGHVQHSGQSLAAEHEDLP
jgi:RNA polymerase sigma-70 factor (ECF subfamily)